MTQITQTQNEGLVRGFEVVVSAESLRKKRDESLKGLAKTARLPGFRPGKVPVHILAQRYGQSVMGEVVENAVNDATSDVIREHNLRPAIQPKIDMKDFQADDDLTFSIHVETLPDVPEVDYSAMTLEKLAVEPDPQELTGALEDIRQRGRKWETAPEDTVADKEKAVLIDFEGRLKGEEKPFPGGTGEKVFLELGDSHFIPGFSEQLEGKKAGDEVQVNVTFPEDYGSKKLAGKEAEFATVVCEVQVSELPELNDAFAEELGYEDLKTLEEDVQERIGREYTNAARVRMKKQLFDYLDDTYDFPLPPTLFDDEFQSIWKQIEEARKEAETEGEEDPFDGKSEDELREEYQGIARRRMKLGLLLAELAKRHNIEVTPQELQQAAFQRAMQFPSQAREIMKHYQEHPERMRELQGPILEEKTVDYILEQVNVTEKTVSSDAFTALMREDGLDDGGDTDADGNAETAKEKQEAAA